MFVHEILFKWVFLLFLKCWYDDTFLAKNFLLNMVFPLQTF